MNDSNFDGLVGQIESVTTVLQEDAKAVINRNVTARAWLTGFYIVEYEQHGQDRAKYGEGLLKALAKRLGGTDYSVPSLKKHRQFYKTFPELSAPIMAYLHDRFQKGYSPIIQLPEPSRQIGESAIIQSGKNDVIVWHGETPSISPWALFGRLSYTHILQFMHLDDLQRTFYAFEAIRGTWSVKELRRQIDSQYYVRSGWSANPSKLSALTLEKAGREMAEYVSTFIDPALFVSKYELELPPKERIVEFLCRENKTEASN